MQVKKVFLADEIDGLNIFKVSVGHQSALPKQQASHERRVPHQDYCSIALLLAGVKLLNMKPDVSACTLSCQKKIVN